MPRYRPSPGTSAADAADRVRALAHLDERAPPGVAPSVVRDLRAAIAVHRRWIEPLRAGLHEALPGRARLLDRLLLSLLAGRPLLVEGRPGCGKSQALRSLAEATGLRHRGVRLDGQSTPADLVLPSPHHAQGPLFHNLVLVEDLDETPPRVQHTLLDAASTGHLPSDDGPLALPDPFLLVACQHPITRTGAYPLDEAVRDRFFCAVALDDPSPAEERAILAGPPAPCAPLADPARIRDARALVREVHVDDRVRDYLLTLVQASRRPEHYGLSLGRYLRHGVSTRVVQELEHAAQVVAFLRGGAYVRVIDLQAIWPDIAGHRLGLRTAAVHEGLTGADIAAALRAAVPRPVVR